VDTTGTASASPALASGNSWYVHVRTRDNAGNWSATASHYGPFYIDSIVPTNPTGAIEQGGAGNNVWQHTVNDPNFTWSGAADANSGVAGYYVYWGTNASGAIPTWVTAAAHSYNPAAVPSPSIYYLRVSTKDMAGNISVWVTLFTFRYDAAAP
jgi:hypothetical protein